MLLLQQLPQSGTFGWVQIVAEMARKSPGEILLVFISVVDERKPHLHTGGGGWRLVYVCGMINATKVQDANNDKVP